MSYPDVYCIKCKNHTDTLGKHTVRLGNQRRALRGVCPICATETYRLMPEKKEEGQKPRTLSLIQTAKAARLSQEHSGPTTEAASRALSTLANHKLDRMSRPSMAQELMFYGSLLICFGAALAIGLLLLLRMVQ